MNALAREHEVEWLTPVPLWGTEGVGLRAPAIVRLDGDDFMDAFAKLLAPKPDAAALRGRRAGVADETKKAGVLYQSLHGCYALACASLTCRAAGRPEKAVAPARGDTVGFVLRRLEANDAESAWIPSGNGEGEWKAANGAVPAPGEEVIPMFPVPLAGSTPRRVWAGLVPTASRETYQPGAPPPDPGEPPPEDLRLAELDDGPLNALAAPAGAPPQGVVVTLQAALALAEFANEHTLSPTDPAKDDIPKLLDSTDLGRAIKNVGFGLAGAMREAWKERHYLLGIDEQPKEPPLDAGGLALPLPDIVRNTVRGAIKDALLPVAAPTTPRRGAVLPKFDVTLAQQYVVRCVYLRTGCPPVASGASEPFAVAPLHDPDAPARTIRIPMPFDISIGALRRFKKNVGFVLSAALNSKVKGLEGKKLKDIDDGNVSDGPPGLGEICTFALPIITLCAMIVLFIFLVLLNIVFFWLPLLKICLPLPKGKS